MSNHAHQAPNILWVMTDQQRYDTVHALGNDAIRTPTLDWLVRRGVAFTRTYVQSPICTPSRASIMTGRYPASHHVHRNGTDRFPSTEEVVTQWLSTAGYHCALIGKHHLSRSHERDEVRPEDGYSTVHSAQDPYPEPRAYGGWLRRTAGLDAYQLHRDLIAAAPYDYGPGVPTDLHHCTWWGSTAVEFIENAPPAPWLLNLNPIDPHPPWFPPAEYLARYPAERMPLPRFAPSDLRRFEKLASIDQQCSGVMDIASFDPDRLADHSAIPIDERNPWDVPPPYFDPRAVVAAYYATIELIDDTLGTVMAALDRTDQLDNTVVVFTSDHGEMLGDHGLLYKGCLFFEGVVRVPLIIAWPRRWQTGLVSHALVETVDIVPTLLEVAGLAIPERVQGRSLTPILTGSADPGNHKSHAVSHYHDALPMRDATHATMVVDSRYKSVVYHNHPGLGELYDLRNDPDEFHDLWDDPGHRALRESVVERHLNAVMGTSDAGIERSAHY